jgi:hypothetical protein
MKDIVIGKLLAHSCGGFVCAMWVSTWWVRARLKSKTIVYPTIMPTKSTISTSE